MSQVPGAIVQRSGHRVFNPTTGVRLPLAPWWRGEQVPHTARAFLQNIRSQVGEASGVAVGVGVGVGADVGAATG